MTPLPGDAPGTRKTCRDPAPELSFHHGQRLAGLPFREELADAEDRGQSRRERSPNLAVDHRVRLAQAMTTLRVAEDDVRACSRVPEA